MQKSGMVILINGVCGVGKSTVARLLYKRLQGFNFHLFDTDDYILENPKTVENIIPYMAFGIVWRWHVYVLKGSPLRRILKRHNVVMPDTFVNSYDEKYLDELAGDGVRIVHFILEADKETIVKRIESDKEKSDPVLVVNRENEFEEGNAFLKTHYPYATRINTVGRTADEVASELYSRIAVL